MMLLVEVQKRHVKDSPDNNNLTGQWQGSLDDNEKLEEVFPYCDTVSVLAEDEQRFLLELEELPDGEMVIAHMAAYTLEYGVGLLWLAANRFDYELPFYPTYLEERYVELLPVIRQHKNDPQFSGMLHRIAIVPSESERTYLGDHTRPPAHAVQMGIQKFLDLADTGANVQDMYSILTGTSFRKSRSTRVSRIM